MKKVYLVFDVADDFEIGLCHKCPFRSGTDNCIIEDKLTKGTCKLNCFCRLKTKSKTKFCREVNYENTQRN